MNLYGYAGADPANSSDPFGLCPPADNSQCPAASDDQNKIQKGINWIYQKTGSESILNVLAGADAALATIGGAISSPGAAGPAAAAGGLAVARGAGEFEGGALAAHEALNSAEAWLGNGYKEIANGVFRSADNARQFRMTASDLFKDLDKGMHVHFESIGANGKQILESTWVRIKP